MLDPVNRGGGFDIIVDDAGHSPLQNFMFFYNLVTTVRPGGYYVRGFGRWRVQNTGSARPGQAELARNHPTSYDPH